MAARGVLEDDPAAPGGRAGLVVEGRLPEGQHRVEGPAVDDDGSDVHDAVSSVAVVAEG